MTQNTGVESIVSPCGDIDHVQLLSGFPDFRFRVNWRAYRMFANVLKEEEVRDVGAYKYFLEAQSVFGIVAMCSRLTRDHVRNAPKRTGTIRDFGNIFWCDTDHEDLLKHVVGGLVLAQFIDLWHSPAEFQRVFLGAGTDNRCSICNHKQEYYAVGNERSAVWPMGCSNQACDLHSMTRLICPTWQPKGGDEIRHMKEELESLPSSFITATTFPHQEGVSRSVRVLDDGSAVY